MIIIKYAKMTIIIPNNYAKFANIFLFNEATQLAKHTKINNNSIN